MARPEQVPPGATADNLPAIKPADVLVTEFGRLKRVIAGMGLRAADAEDVLQAVSVKSLAGSERFADHRQCVRWLIQVTTNECITEHRRRSRFRRKAPAIADRTPAQEDCPVENAAASERFEAVQEALRDLDDEQLKPLALKYFCGFSSGEIGEILGMPAPTVRAALCRARMTLAKSLMSRGIGNEP
jgi:RNA polymerase sigma factor (sigma-70 family)